MSKKVFISYSRADKEEVLSFVSKIEKEIRIECWIDKKGIESGAEFERVIKTSISDSEVILFMVSVSSLLSEWTYKEIMYASKQKKRIVPVLLTGHSIRGWFKAEFENLDYIDISNYEQIEKLFDDLRNWVGKPKTEKWKCDDNNITVIFPNGEEISCNSMNQTLQECILKIGPKAVMSLHYRPNKDELIYEYDIPALNLVEIVKGRSKFYVQKLQGKNITDSLVKISDSLDCGLTIYTPFAEDYEPNENIVKDIYKNHFKNLEKDTVDELYKKTLSVIYDENASAKDIEVAFNTIKSLAAADYSEAWVELGLMYERGIGTEENRQSAIQCYHKASELNNAYGDFNLAYYYMLGWEFEKDIDEAIRLFNKSYSSSNAVSQEDIANAYYHIARNTDNENLIKEYCNKAIEIGHETAKEFLTAYEEHEYNTHIQKVKFEINEIFSANGNLVLSGKMLSGYIKEGDPLVILHEDEIIKTTATQIFQDREKVQIIMPDDCAAIWVVDVQKKQVSKGDIVDIDPTLYLDIS